MSDCPTYEMCPCGAIMWNYDIRIEHEKHYEFAARHPEYDNRLNIKYKKMENEIQNPFDYINPTDQSVEEIIILRSKCRELHEVLLTLKPSRERSLAITKLEEVSMWGNKSIVLNQ